MVTLNITLLYHLNLKSELCIKSICFIPGKVLIEEEPYGCATGFLNKIGNN